MRPARLLLLALFCTLLATVGSATEEKGIERLAWLAGNWENARKNVRTEEVWLPALGNTMMCVSRVVKDDSLLTYEMVIIREHGSRLAYEAHPEGQQPATFLSTRITPSSIVFENLEHDFPQRVGYELIGTDSLYAWVEGPSGGKTKRNEFPYRRSPRAH